MTINTKWDQILLAPIREQAYILLACQTTTYSEQNIVQVYCQSFQ